MTGGMMAGYGSWLTRIIAGVTLSLLAACSRPGGEQPESGAQDRSGGGRTGATAAADSSSTHPAIVFLGTSLSAGYGLDPESAFPAVVQRRIDSLGLPYTVVNAGQSGESSAGALQRVDWIMRQPPFLLIIETGANDGLRGQDPDSLKANIQAIIDRVRSRGPQTRIVLAGMEALPNLGAEYTRRFHAVYPALARVNGVPLIPFLLDGVAGVDSLNQQDGIHPNERGAEIVAGNVWRVLEPQLR